MPHRAQRLSHAFFCAPIAALLAIAFAPVGHAQNSSVTNPPPTPYTVVVDPGHGGTPDNNYPNQPFDPGVIGPNGVMEKDVTLDISKRVATLLTAEKVHTVLTRNTDQFESIPDREQVAIDNHADLFVSIHCNSFQTSNVVGSLVLYPNDNSLSFAQLMSQALQNALAVNKISNTGVQLKNDLWVHATIPTVTVEGAYLSNPAEAALLTKPNFRQNIARGIVSGIGAQLPGINKRKTDIEAYDHSHLQLLASNSTSSLWQNATLRNGLLLMLLATLFWQRHLVFVFAGRGIRNLYCLSFYGTTASTRKKRQRRRAVLQNQPSRQRRQHGGIGQRSRVTRDSKTSGSRRNSRH